MITQQLIIQIQKIKMEMFKIQDCRDYVTCLPENIPEYLFKFKKYQEGQKSNRNTKLSPIKKQQRHSIANMNFLLDTQKYTLPLNFQTIKPTFNNDLRLFFQKVRDDRAMQTQKCSKKKLFLKSNLNFQKGTLSLIQLQQNTRKSMQKVILDKKLKKEDMKEIDMRNSLITKIFTNYKDQIYLLYEQREVIICLCKYFEFLYKSEFLQVLQLIGCKNINSFFEKIFWLFDINYNGIIELEDIEYGINKFVEYISEHKVSIFFNFCDHNKEGFLNPQKITEFLQDCLKNDNEKITLQKNISEFLTLIKCKNIERIDKQELVQSCQIHNSLLKIVESSIRTTKVKKQIQQKQEVDFSQLQIINFSELTTGLTVTYFNKVLDFTKHAEGLYNNLQQLKQEFKKNKIKDNKNLDIDSDDD